MNKPPPPSSSQNPSPQPVQYVLAPYAPEDEEINLLDYWRVLTRYKWMIIMITLLATAAATAVALLMTPIYRAEVLLAPVSGEEQSGMAALAGQLGGLASIAGVNLKSGSTSAEESLATLSSRAFIGKFITDEKLLPVLFEDEWDAEAQDWIKKTAEKAPTLLRAHGLFTNEALSASTNKKTGLVTVAVEWRDPELAARWANELVARLNGHEKRVAISEAERSIGYLKEQLGSTSVVEIQQAVHRLIEGEMKKIMLANVRDQYAFKIIDPAVTPEKKVKPKRGMIVILGLMGGVSLGVIVAFISSLRRRGQINGNEAVAKSA